MSGATTVTRAPQSSRLCALRAATGPAPTTRQGRCERSSETGKKEGEPAVWSVMEPGRPDHACRDGGEAELVDQDEAAGDAVRHVGVDRERRGRAQRDHAD